MPPHIQACELIASKTLQNARILFAGVVRIAVPGDTDHYSNLPAESPMGWQTEIGDAKFQPIASAMLFTGAKVSHLAFLPQGAPERRRRVLGMLRAMGWPDAQDRERGEHIQTRRHQNLLVK